MPEDLDQFEVRPGDRQVSAELLNQLIRRVRRLEALSAEGGILLDNTGPNPRLGLPAVRPGFWAKLTGESSGAYSWKQQRRSASGTFSDLANGRSGTTSSNSARDVNGTTGIASGTFVWLTEGFPTVSGSTLNQEWVFEHKPASGGGGGTLTHHAVRATYDVPISPQTIANNTATAITFNQEDYDTDSYHSTSSNTSRLTIPTGLGGAKLIIGYVEWSSNATGYRALTLFKNGNTTIEQEITPAASGVLTCQHVMAEAVLQQGDYVELFVQQNSGGNVDIARASFTLRGLATFA